MVKKTFGRPISSVRFLALSYKNIAKLLSAQIVWLGVALMLDPNSARYTTITGTILGTETVVFWGLFCVVIGILTYLAYLRQHDGMHRTRMVFILGNLTGFIFICFAVYFFLHSGMSTAQGMYLGNAYLAYLLASEGEIPW